MTLERMGKGLRRIAQWAWKTLAALATFVVIYRLTLFFDQWQLQITAQASLVAVAAVAVALGKRLLPGYPRRRRAALLAEIQGLRPASPDFTAAALRHFRLRSRLLALATGLLMTVAGCGLWSAFGGPRSHGLLTVVVLLFVLVDSGLGLDAEMRRLRTLAAAASCPDAVRRAVVLSSARRARDSADPVSQAIWRRLVPEAPAPASS